MGRDMPYRAVLFDLDGTLVDSLRGIEHSAREALARILPGRVLPSLRDIIGPRIEEVFKTAVPGIGSDTLNELVRCFRQSYDNGGWQMSSVYEGIPRLLADLSGLGMKLFVVTNKPKSPSERILQFLGIAHFFEEVVTPDSVQPPFESKSEAIEYLITTRGLELRDMLFVGDSADDAEASARCGIRFAAVTYGYGKIDLAMLRPGDVVLDCPTDLLGFVQQ